MTILVEACVDSVDSALAAQRGGAGRLELCDNLSDAGTTPSAGMIAAVRERVSLPLFVIARPRGGGFVYSASELDVMRRDIDLAKRLGIDGVVIGVLREDATVDAERTAWLVAEASPLPVTFHRAFDLAPRLGDALDTLIACGVARVLTSGGALTALEGTSQIAALVERASGRIEVMAGGGVREETVRTLVERSGVREIHVRGTRLARTPQPPSPRMGVRLRKPLPDDEGAWEETDEARIRAFVSLANRGAPSNG